MGIRNVAKRVRVRLERRRDEDEEASEKVKITILMALLCSNVLAMQYDYMIVCYAGQCILQHNILYLKQSGVNDVWFCFIVQHMRCEHILTYTLFCFVPFSYTLW
jgi:hypothetical protein